METVLAETKPDKTKGSDQKNPAQFINLRSPWRQPVNK